MATRSSKADMAAVARRYGVKAVERYGDTFEVAFRTDDGARGFASELRQLGMAPAVFPARFDEDAFVTVRAPR